LPSPRRLAALLLCLALVTAATGWARDWTVEREDGVAWLRAPDGRRFYSKGVNLVSGFEATEKNRNGVPLAEGIGFFWGARYPDPPSWRRHAKRRLLAWGFNTRGGWSDPSPTFGLPLTPDIELGRGAQLHWSDPFAPDARERTFAAARALLAPFAQDGKDEQLLGVFTDNEVGWWNSQLFRWYLARPPDNWTKKRLLTLLRARYGDSWERLLADFAPAGAASFAELEATGAALKLRPGGQGIALVNAFTQLAAARYYRLTRDAVQAARPGTLVLGDRLPLYYNQDAVLGMRGLVDVLSTNYNLDDADGWVAPWYFESLEALTQGLPVLVSEWFCAAHDNRSGNRNNGHLLSVPDQADRTRAAEAALRNFAALPNVLGTHWFQLYDEPFGGRADGEDYNFGLLDRFDQPYAELTAMFARVNPVLERIHATARFEDPAPTQRLRRAKGPRLNDAALTDWDKRGARLRGWAVQAPYAPFGDAHLAWSEAGLYLMHLAQNHLEPGFLDYAGEFPFSEAYQLNLSLDAGAGERRFRIVLSPSGSTRWRGVWELVPQAYVLTGKGLAPAKGTLVAQLPKPLPHIALEAFLPASALGVPALRAGQTLRLSLDVRGFFRERRMTFPGPAQDPFGPDAPVPTAPLLLEE
jgi:hypothetical protein